jgi:hypothetical protein
MRKSTRGSKTKVSTTPPDPSRYTYLVEEVGNTLGETAIGPATVNKHKSLKKTELTDCIVGRHDGLPAFFTSNTNTNVGFLDHGNIVGTITNGQRHDIKADLDKLDDGRLLRRAYSTAKD